MIVLAQRIHHSWRVLATGFSFCVFGTGGLLLAVTLFPLLRCLSWNDDVLRGYVQRSIHHAFRFFVWLMRSLGLLTWDVHGAERLLRPGQLIIANHPSLIDVVFLIALMPEVDCIVKEELRRNPFLGWSVAWARYIPNRTAERLLDDCVAALHSGRSLIVFPEGTRTVPGRPLNLKRGAAQIALAARVPIVPVTILCDPPTLTKAGHWYEIPACRPHWTLHVGEPFHAADIVSASQPQPIAARRLTRHFLSYFTSRIAGDAVPLAKPLERVAAA